MDQLLKHLKMYPQQVISELDLMDISLNIDGLETLWSILCQLNLSPPTVFLWLSGLVSQSQLTLTFLMILLVTFAVLWRMD